MLITVVAGCKPATPEKQLRRALRAARVDDVKRHLDGGLDANAPFDDGHRPLHVVADSIHASREVAQLLIDRGADVNATTPEGETVWDVAWGEPDEGLGDEEIGLLLLLLESGASPSPASTSNGESRLHIAARKADSARLMTVLIDDHGGDTSAVDENGWTPLHVAVHENHVGSVTGLLSGGADPNAETTATIGRSWRYEAGSRPLDVVPRSNRVVDVREVKKVLEEHGGTENPDVNNSAR